jgi:hypothetical protein
MSMVDGDSAPQCDGFLAASMMLFLKRGTRSLGIVNGVSSNRNPFPRNVGNECNEPSGSQTRMTLQELSFTRAPQKNPS